MEFRYVREWFQILYYLYLFFYFAQHIFYFAATTPILMLKHYVCKNSLKQAEVYQIIEI